MRHPIAALATAALLLGAAPVYAATDATEEANKKMFRAFVEDVFNKHNVNATDKYVAANAVDHSPGPGQKPGFAGIKAMFADMNKDMPDMKVVIDDLVADGDRVTARMTMTGTPTKPMMGMKPTGKPFKATWIDWITVKNGKMVDHWGYGDMDAMMKAYQKPAAHK